ncbi:MAG: ParB N-terminal domain-containing protein [Candidatus Adiutrix sp.]|jgi:hypothetical protein|nr:ParB N-terminal domain-containing protein [Candidatus Adiutrix sp.]
MIDFTLAALAPMEAELAPLKPLMPSSYGRGVEGLAESIRALGLLRPLLIWADGGEHYLLAGSLRREALMRQGRSVAPALMLPPDFPREQAFALALADNQERGWNQAETALLWRFFVETLGTEGAANLAPYLGLAPSPKMREWCLRAAGLPEQGLAALAEGRLDLETGARLAGWAPENLGPALNLFDLLNPSKQKKKQWLDWLEDISRREFLCSAEVLEVEDIRTALADVERVGRPATEEIIRKYLWTRRHPLLAELAAARQARVRALALPRAARLELDPSLEDLKFGLNLTFATPAEFGQVAETVAKLRQSPDFQKLLDDDHES